MGQVDYFIERTETDCEGIFVHGYYYNPEGEEMQVIEYTPSDKKCPFGRKSPQCLDCMVKD